jgi:hypothetical protein
MTNVTLQAFVDEFGWDKICAIGFDNNATLFVGYTDSVKSSDISLVTKGGIDFICTSKIDISHGTPVPFKTYSETSKIQWIAIMDENKGYGIDPIFLK